jgi:bifunctional non-homologous end joining protein LigD
VAERVVKEKPEQYTSTMSKARRKGKIFIDYLRNGRGATAVATFSTRARHGATVALPVSWKELNKINPLQFTVATVPKRLAGQETDPWHGFETTRQSITQTMLRKLGLS